MNILLHPLMLAGHYSLFVRVDPSPTAISGMRSAVIDSYVRKATLAEALALALKAAGTTERLGEVPIRVELCSGTSSVQAHFRKWVSAQWALIAADGAILAVTEKYPL